jgi:hypothetical protein
MSEMEMFRVADGRFTGQWLLNDICAAPSQLGLFDPDHWRESICSPANPACAFMRMIKTYRCPELSVARHFSF